MKNLRYMLTLPDMPTEKEVKEHSAFWLGFATGLLTLSISGLLIYAWMITCLPIGG